MHVYLTSLWREKRGGSCPAMSYARKDREVCKQLERSQSRLDTHGWGSRPVRLNLHGVATPTD